MLEQSHRFIAQMKLRELHTQRERLVAAYDALEAKVQGLSSESEKISALYHGLREISFAGESLHPDVVNLEPLLHSANFGSASPAMLGLWQRKLEQELQAGRQRCNCVYAFGALLEEWTARGAPDLSSEGQERLSRLLESRRHQPAEDSAFEGVLAMLSADWPIESLKDFWSRKQDELQRRIEQHELTEVLQSIEQNPYRSAAVRAEARNVASDPTLVNELADALTILWQHFDEWQWPEQGVKARAVWTRNKWRLSFLEDLPTACFLELMGERWQAVFRELWGVSREQRRLRLERLIELKAPALIIRNERRRLATQSPGLSTPEPMIWLPGTDEEPSHELTQPVSSVAHQRSAVMQELRSSNISRGYASDSTDRGLASALSLINAELQLLRAAFPELPLIVLKVDLKDFYQSLKHADLLKILAACQAPAGFCRFVERFVKTRVNHHDASFELQQGIPMNHNLSLLLGDLPLSLLENWLRRSAKVRIVRFVDDLCLLAPSNEEMLSAWKALQEFCRAAQWQLNEDKCGSLAIGGECAEILPEARPRWSLLELQETGEWALHEGSFQGFLEQSRARVQSSPSVLAKVSLYNDDFKTLMRWLVPSVDLGVGHRAAISEAANRFHESFFGGDSGSFSKSILRLIESRYLASFDVEHIPEAWLYWPITAGGLGLTHPLIEVSAYRQARAKGLSELQAPSLRTATWEEKPNDWSLYYSSFFKTYEPEEPRENRVMKALVQDFVKRGTEMSGRAQAGLKPYWRWVLTIYGPQILEYFGSFRFLITELVPLQLIMRGRMTSTSPTDAKSRAMRRPEIFNDDLPF